MPFKIEFHSVSNLNSIKELNALCSTVKPISKRLSRTIVLYKLLQV